MLRMKIWAYIAGLTIVGGLVFYGLDVAINSGKSQYWLYTLAGALTSMLWAYLNS